MKFDLGSVSHWSGAKESCAHPCVIHPPMLGCKCSYLLKTDLPGLVRFLTWLLRSRPMTHRTQIKLHLTGKPCLILVFYYKVRQVLRSATIITKCDSTYVRGLSFGYRENLFFFFELFKFDKSRYFPERYSNSEKRIVLSWEVSKFVHAALVANASKVDASEF